MSLTFLQLTPKAWLISGLLCRNMHRWSIIHGWFRKRLCISCAKTQSYYCANSLFFTQGSVSCKDSSQNELKEVLSEVIEIVNFIKTRPVKSRIFFKLTCKDMDSQHVRLLLHTEVRWLSKGKVLSRVHELQKELLTFFETEGHEQFCNYLMICGLDWNI